MKKLFCLLMIVILCLGVSGCMLLDKVKLLTEDIYAGIDFPKEVMEYLNELYDDTFTFAGGGGGDGSGMAAFWGTDFEILSEKYGGQKFTVCLDIGGFNDDEERAVNVKKHFYDNYFRLQMTDDANDFFADILENCGIDAVLRTFIPGHERPEGLLPNATFEDYLRQSKVRILVYIYSPEKIPHEQQLAFANKVAALEGEYGFFSRHFYNTDSDGTINEYTRSVVPIYFCLTRLSVNDMREYQTYDELYHSNRNRISAKTYEIYSDLQIKEYEEKEAIYSD